MIRRSHLTSLQASSAGLSNLLDVEHKQKRLNSRSNTSRHSRFGTTVSVLSGSNRFVQSRQSAITATGDQSMDIGKRKVYKKAKDQVSKVMVVFCVDGRRTILVKPFLAPPHEGI